MILQMIWLGLVWFGLVKLLNLYINHENIKGKSCLEYHFTFTIQFLANQAWFGMVWFGKTSKYILKPRKYQR